jgi:hypothetical protein
MVDPDPVGAGTARGGFGNGPDGGTAGPDPTGGQPMGTREDQRMLDELVDVYLENDEEGT